MIDKQTLEMVEETNEQCQELLNFVLVWQELFVFIGK
ncbi:hypothetical protein Ga0466249_004644 [Sporomusaceae bacterium BoRhaA]|nr:hypothetical protein [Pelorhabdus rhamnosifermentans]